MNPTLTTLIVAAAGGLGGAIAGGAVTLSAQILNHRWENINSLLKEKKHLYSEIISVGAYYIGEDVFKKLNRDISSALVICDRRTIPILRAYAKVIQDCNREVEESGIDPEKDKEKIAELLTKHRPGIKKTYDELLQQIRKEIEID